MAKTVFRPGEAKQSEDKVMLPLFKDYSPVEEVIEDVPEEYTGPSGKLKSSRCLVRLNFPLMIL